MADEISLKDFSLGHIFLNTKHLHSNQEKTKYAYVFYQFISVFHYEV